MRKGNVGGRSGNRAHDALGCSRGARAARASSRRRRRPAIYLLAVLVSAASLGCQDSGAISGADKPAAHESEKAAASSHHNETVQSRDPGTRAPAAGHRPAPTSADDAEPAQPQMPQVVMSNSHAATCLVKVGDMMPEAKLADLDGNQQSLAQLFGDRLTVVFFWSVDSVHALVELEELGPDVDVPFADQGLRVIGINVHDGPDPARKAVEKAGAQFPILLDSDGSYHALVATAPPPRTFLLDGKGKILWLDIEYSRETRRLLEEAIRFVLGQE